MVVPNKYSQAHGHRTLSLSRDRRLDSGRPVAKSCLVWPGKRPNQHHFRQPLQLAKLMRVGRRHRLACDRPRPPATTPDYLMLVRTSRSCIALSHRPGLLRLDCTQRPKKHQERDHRPHSWLKYFLKFILRKRRLRGVGVFTPTRANWGHLPTLCPNWLKNGKDLIKNLCLPLVRFYQPTCPGKDVVPRQVGRDSQVAPAARYWPSQVPG